MLDTAPAPLRNRQRAIFGPDHLDFRDAARAFCRKEAAPRVPEWEAAGFVDREFWKRAAAQGFVGFDVPERFGGAGVTDFRFNAILDEELCYAGAITDNFSLQNDILSPYLVELTNDEQKQRWLPGFVTGALMAAVAMTEPGAGSDLGGISTIARRTGDGYAITGSKTFITSGIQADLTIVAARLEDAPAGQLTLIAVEADRDGYHRGRSLHKIGRKGQDTAELFFDEVIVPVENRLGAEGEGLELLKHNLPQERLSIAVTAVAGAETAFELALEYSRDRATFGRPLVRHQAIRHALAEMRADLDAGRSYLDRCLMAHVEGQLAAADAAAVKFWTTEMQFRVTDRCLQLFGGYGYMDEYPISRLWRDCRVQRIYGGTTEIMKDIVGRSLER
jgi:alkylation response protein AidB-like acyl-CoA dehydrogenase